MLDENINLLFIADIVGQPGCEILIKLLPDIKKQYDVDFVIANGENANNNGKGITLKIANRFFEAGVNIITGGNHTWESRKNEELFEGTRSVLRPANYPAGNIGNGSIVAQTPDGTRIAVLNLQGRTFLYPILCPFRFADELLPTLRQETNIIVIDFHAEATAEKIALGWHLDGKISALIGTHTHVQTADERILPQGTAYITDVGMTGAHDSVIGMKIETAIYRFTHQTPTMFEVASANAKICGALVKVNRETGKASSISRVQFP